MKEDCIKIEEIKMFLGVGLQIEYMGKSWFVEAILDGSNKGEVEICNYEDNCCNEILLISDIRPLVRPLSELTQTEMDGMYGCCSSFDIELLSQDFGDLGADAYVGVVGGLFVLNELAKRHYDIFNWISRGLADKLED